MQAVMIVGGEGELEEVKEGQKVRGAGWKVVDADAGEGHRGGWGGDAQEGEGTVHKLAPGTMYALTGHERHFLRATRGDLQCVCVFTPPIAGSEDHNAEGVYPVVDDAGVAKFSIAPEDVVKLFVPPESLRKGNTHGKTKLRGSGAASKSATAVVTDAETATEAVGRVPRA
jgi:Ectoine synthase